MAKKKASDRLMKLREFDIKYAISGYTKAQIIDYLSDLEIPEPAW